MKKYSLYTLFLIIFIILILVSVVSTYFLIDQHRKNLLEIALEEKIRLAATINETIASPLWFYRMNLVPGLEKAFVLEMAKFKDVRYIRIVKFDGSIYQSSIEEEWGKTIEDPDIQKAITTKKIIVKDEVFRGEKLKIIIYPGYQDRTIWVGFSLKETKEISKVILIHSVLMISSILIIFIGLIFFIVFRTVINPIKKLALICEEVRKGNLKVKMPVTSKTEIGELATVFNEMIKNLRESYAALEEAKTVLEIKVQARTRELRELVEHQEEVIKERTRKIQEKMEELEKFHRLVVGRELKMIQLKEEIEKLKKELEKCKGRKIKKRE